MIAAYRQGSVRARQRSLECLGEGQADVGGIKGFPYEAHMVSLIDAGVELVESGHKDHLGGRVARNITLHKVDAVADALEGRFR